jgi:uncharacterized protein (TIGR02145 family)
MLNKSIVVLSSALSVLALLLLISCSKDKPTSTSSRVAVLTTAAATAVTQTTARSGGTITSDSGITVTERGVCWSTNTTPTVADNKTIDGAGVGTFTSYITGLAGGTPYYVRAYASNSAGIGYGSAIWFTTLPTSNPELTTAAVRLITQTTAECGGIITYDGAAPVIACGVCWGISPMPTISDNKTIDGAGVGNFVSSITGLAVSTPYYVRAYATNSFGTGYGGAIWFITLHDSTGAVTDIDGNIYLTVKIGNQWWMAENLKVTHYRNGNSIPNVTDASVWAGLITGAYCNYDNDTTHVDDYGRLYNWYAVDDSSNIAPTGWHVASNSEWQTLVDYLGGDAVASGKMKEAGTMHWQSPNTGATNESGFSALAGGGRRPADNYFDMGRVGYFWTSTVNGNTAAWFRYLHYNNTIVIIGNDSMQLGFSVRCVRD